MAHMGSISINIMGRCGEKVASQVTREEERGGRDDGDVES
jgi:hypothetical protein